MRIFDFNCSACGNAFEVFVKSNDDGQQCPQCGSTAVTRQQVTQMGIRTSKNRRGRTIDLSSNSCPCHNSKAARHG